MWSEVWRAIFRRAEETEAFDKPGRVVGLAERERRLPQLLGALAVPHPQQDLLQRADKPLGAAIALRGADEGGRTLDAEAGDRFRELVGHVSRSVLVAHRQTAGDRLGEP